MTDRFVVSQLISVAIQVGCFQVGLKPGQLYVRLSIIFLIYQSTYVSLGIINHYVVAFVCLHFTLTDTRVLNSHKELCITRVEAVNYFAPGGHIYCHPQTDRFVVSQFISVARNAGRFKLGSKPAQLYVIYIYIYIYFD